MPGKINDKKVYLFAGSGLLLLAALVMLYLQNPETSYFFPPCPFHYLTGFYCPGCGSLRAIHELLHLDIMAALDNNPLMVISIPILIVLQIWKKILYHPVTPWIAFVIIIVYGILRNIPVFPLSWLAPD
ncbi:DUF2752 domain-containing protein [bacterium]|nr:DUF2752 domain-containing protein [candidate division CSSED10-310 bacterium]